MAIYNTSFDTNQFQMQGGSSFNAVNSSFISAARSFEIDQQAQDGVFSYATYGVGSAIVSGGVGLINTVISLGDTLGIVDGEEAMLDEEESVRNVFGQDAGDFYVRHKEGVDFAGMIGSSIIPGALAVKALRTVQATGKVASHLGAATGLARTDILLDSAVVAGAKKSVLASNSTSTIMNGEYWNAMRAGFVQQVLENAAATAGVVLVNNQNATLNPENLSYMEAVSDQLSEGWMWFGAGVAAGTLIDGLRISGSIRRYVKAEQNKEVATINGKPIVAGDLQNIYVPEMTGMVGGDRLNFLAQEAIARNSVKKDLMMEATTESGKVITDGGKIRMVPKSGMENAMRNYYAGDSQLNTMVATSIEEINNAGKFGFDWLKGQFDTAAANVLDKSIETGAQKILPALDDVRYIKPTKLERGGNMAFTVKDKLWDVRNAIATRTDLPDLAPNVRAVHESILGMTPKKYTPMSKELQSFLGVQSVGDGIKVIAKDLPNIIKKSGGLKSLKKRFPTDEAWLNGNVVEATRARTTAFVDVRTGKLHSNVVPSIRDFGDVSFKLDPTSGRKTLSSTALNRSFTANTEVWDSITKQTDVFGSANKATTLRDLDAQWHIGHLTPLKVQKLPTGEEAVVLSSKDLAGLEGAYTKLKAGAGEGLDKVVIKVDNQIYRLKELERLVIENKSKLISSLAQASVSKSGLTLTVEEIALAANTSVDVVQGQVPLVASNVVGSTFDKPRYLQVGYKNRRMEDIDQDISQFVGTQQRQQLYMMQKAEALGKLNRGGMLESLQGIKLQGIGGVSQLDSRSTAFAAMSPDFGTMRENAGFVGTQVKQQMERTTVDVAAEMQPFRVELAKPENAAASKELVLAFNEMRKGNMILQGNRLVSEAVDEDGFPVKIIDMSDPVARIVQHWKTRSAALYQQDNTIKAAKGGISRSNNTDIVRAPQVDPRRFKFQAFAMPRSHQQAVDDTRYMVYAQTQEEFNAKVAALRNELGENYHITQSTQSTKEFHKAMQDYDLGKEFRDLWQDSSGAFRGRTANITPDLITDYNYTLDDIQASLLRKEHYITRAATELNYADEIAVMRNTAAYMDEPTNRSLLQSLTKPAAHIYDDTIRTMLNIPVQRTGAMSLFDSVNEVVAQRGSRVVDFITAGTQPLQNAVKWIGAKMGKEKSAAAPLFKTEADYTDFLSKMESQGYDTPLKKLTDAVLASSNPAMSRSLEVQSRVLANLLSTTMLRADPTHSMLQLTSSSILALPVLREFAESLPNAARMLKTVNPAVGAAEPSISKLYMQGMKEFWKPTDKAFRDELLSEMKAKGAITDYLNDLLESTDMTAINGNHGWQQANEAINKLAKFTGKWAGHFKSEEMSRFSLAYAMARMAKEGGRDIADVMPSILNGVQKVHGNYNHVQRPQLFQGVIGQNVGMFQTYFFNMMQHVGRRIADGEQGKLAVMGAMQTGLFGAQSIPGFSLMNSLVAETSEGNMDLYSVTDSNDPNSWNAWVMYGLGSQALFGMDVASRGNLNPRYMTVVPTDMREIATVSAFGGALANVVSSFQLASNPDVSGMQAFLHGLAHNGMNRPLQGLGTLMQGRVTSRDGQADVVEVWRDSAGEIAWSGMFARLLGSRPVDEAITRNHYYRQLSYDNMQREAIADLGTVVQMNATDGDMDWAELAKQYQAAGGNLRNFNAFASKNLMQASEGKVDKFRRTMELDRKAQAAMKQMQLMEDGSTYYMDGNWQ